MRSVPSTASTAMMSHRVHGDRLADVQPQRLGQEGPGKVDLTALFWSGQSPGHHTRAGQFLGDGSG